MCVFQAQHHPPTTVQPLCHRMQLGPPLRVRRRLHLRPPPRCFQVRHVASAWTGSPEAISASSLFLILQSILFSELESLWDIISVIWFSTFPSRHRLKTFFFFKARDETRLRGGIYKPVNRIHFYFTRKRLCYISEQPDIQPHVSFQVKPP